MRSRSSLCWVTLIGATALFIWHPTPARGSTQSDPAQGAGPCSPVGIPTDARPNPNGPPTEVTVAVFMVDLTKVDDPSQSLTGDFLVFQSWTDPRLAELAGCRLPLTTVWHPRLDFLNSGAMQPRRATLADQVEIGPGGLVQHQQRYFGSLSTYHSLREFPLDRQAFLISLVSPDYAQDEVSLVVDERQTGRRSVLNISDWIVDSVYASLGTYSPETAVGRTLATYEFRIVAGRQVGFYVWKVILPLALIVAMSWAVFWISPIQFGPQIGLSATAMLTLIAFQFALVSVLPKLAYFTVLDEFIAGSTILVFLALVEAVLAVSLVAADKKAMALRMDAICRWAFPLTYGFLILAVFLI